MKEGVFLDKSKPPDAEEIICHVEVFSASLWQKLSGFIETSYRLKAELKFYGKETGWVIRYSKSGKPLFTLIPNPGGFSVLIVIGPSLNEKTESLDLGEKVRSIFINARQYHDGKWLLIKMDSDKDMEDLKKLIVLKAGTPALKKS